MSHPITVVDAFTDTPFSGNPAAVCLLAAPTTDAWMQAVAAEMNLAETAFAVPRPDGPAGDYDLRWFTPTTEVDLCGHATLATTHVLGTPARFHTRSGLLVCRPPADERGTIEMEFPANPPEPVPDEARAVADWSGALGLPTDRVRSLASTPNGWVLVELAEPADVRSLTPDGRAVTALSGAVVVAAAPGDRPGVDSVCRVFAPGYGIPEDPVTGAAHCVLAPWLAARSERTEFTGEQASARGGTVGMRLHGERVVLTGRAVTVVEAKLLSSPPRP